MMSASLGTQLEGEARQLMDKADSRPSPEAFEMAALRFMKAASAYRREAAERAGNGDNERQIEKLDAAELAIREAASALDKSANEDAARSFRAAEKLKARRADA